MLAAVPLKRKSDKPKLILNLASSWITSRKEELVYPFVSFVAEFGGSLGLFLGFSFNMFWEVFEYLYLIVKKYIR